jgi:beta-lactam-binding protein with PASTA domain
MTFEPAALGAPGRVIGQSPPPGFGLREGGEVSVRVAGSPSDVIEMIQSGRDN